MGFEQLHFQFQKLSEFFDPNLTIETIEGLIEDVDGEEEEQILASLTVTLNAKENSSCLNMLLELSSVVRQTRIDEGHLQNTTDSWEFLSNYVNKSQYLCFIQCLTSLASVNLGDSGNRKLTLLGAQTYILTLAIPGAKRCGVFDEKILRKIVKLFHLLTAIKDTQFRKIRAHEVMEFHISFLTLMEDFQILFKHVSLDEYKELQEEIYVSMKNLILYYHTHGYSSSCDYNLTSRAYGLLKVMCDPLHGNITDNMMKIFSITFVLHNYSAPVAKFNLHRNGPHGDHITDFFIFLLEAFPTNTTNVLTNYIESIISNPKENIRNEEYQQQLEIAVKYDTAMFSKCNVSIVSYLEKACLCDEFETRLNATDLLGRILLIDAKVNWSLFQDEISKIPREIYILKTLFEKALDVNHNVKLKALNSLHKAFTIGNKNTKNILKYSFSGNPQSEGDEEIGGLELLEEQIKQFPQCLLHLFYNHLAHVRKAALVLLELLASMNRTFIDNRLFEEGLVTLAQDQTPLVRKQIITSLNNLMNIYPHHKPMIKVWTKCILLLMKDSDAKIVDATMESLKLIIFDNIERYEDSATNVACMPWIILRCMLQEEFRGILRNAVDSWIKNNLLTPKTLSIIESHTNTANSTEAWLLLSLVANKMRSRNPDMIATSFGVIIQENSFNSFVNLHLMLEVVYAWMGDFSHPVINQLYEIIHDLLLTGSATSSLVSSLYEICVALRKLSKPDSDKKWIEEMNEEAKLYIFDKQSQFDEDEYLEERLINYLYIYSETITDLSFKPDAMFLRYFTKFLNTIANKKLIDACNEKLSQKICVIIIVMTRMALRDSGIATEIVPNYGKILKITKHKTIANNLIVALTDLCKKHTTLTEPTMQEVVTKIQAEYTSIRYRALSSVTTLVMQDYLKMRGRLLMNVLAAIVDPCRNIAKAAAGMVLKYVEEKNSHLLQISLLESVYAYNGYTQFDGLDLFNGSELKGISPLQGRKKVKSRQFLYQFFIQNIPDQNLLMFLGNVNLFYDKISKDKFIKNTEGINAIQDLIYVFTKICNMKNWNNLKNSGTAERGNQTQNQNQELDSIQSTSLISETLATEVTKAASVIEKMIAIIPKLYSQIQKFDKSLEVKMNRFCEAICENFKHFVEFLQPVFWDKFKDKMPKKSKRSKMCDKQLDPADDVSSSESDTGKYDDNSEDFKDF